MTYYKKYITITITITIPNNEFYHDLETPLEEKPYVYVLFMNMNNSLFTFISTLEMKKLCAHCWEYQCVKS